ncbi:MAG: single-stranded-DNA-specific exonuclease RecJ [Deltaproteobacteria bacterium]|nr:MAG: single-stranded-DNA-specific exonuclease RecJ [Deltaproteobacteria bacterium]
MRERLSWSGARWVARPTDPDRLERLQRVGLSAVAAQCLATREAPEDPQPWLEPSLDHLIDPFEMLHMESAVLRLRRAIDKQQRVRIITDYDVDGTTSSLILQACLQLLGLRQVDYHIPDRFDEGYGFSPRAAERAAEDGVELIVTADIGVRDHQAVTVAVERGLDVLICDHHLPAGASVPPEALVLCPPQADCEYPNPHLAACGVSLKLAQALLIDHPKKRAILRSLLKLAAIGTVADMVPLTSLENRAIVALGLRELNLGPHAPGLTALLQVSGLTPGKILTRDLGFRIGPRINAAGRVASARLVIKLLTSRDPVEARALARQLNELNNHRKQIQLRMVELAKASVPSPLPPFVLVAHPEGEAWHRGVAGIVASRLKDDLHRPTAIVAIQGDHAVASVRCPPSIHAVRALDAASDLLVKYGGHPAAAGFTVPTPKLDALAARLSAYVERAASADTFVPEYPVDASVPLSELSDDLLEELGRLGPFGMGNPEPSLLVRDVEPERISVRASGRLLHLKLPAPQGRSVEAIWWGQGERAAAFAGPVDLLGTLEANEYNGRRSLQIKLTDVRQSGADA